MTNLPIGDSDVAALTAAAEELNPKPSQKPYIVIPQAFAGCSVFDNEGISSKLLFHSSREEPTPSPKPQTYGLKLAV